MPSIGITGLPATGKSTVTKYLREFGAEVCCADELGHQVLNSPEVLAAVADLLGSQVVTPEGIADRRLIAGRVFADADLLEAYNQLIHPALLEAIRCWLDGPISDAPDVDCPIKVLEAALIPEWGIEEWFDEVWCVECSLGAALQRWKKDKEFFFKIIQAQYAPEKKQENAERIITNERSQKELRRCVEHEWNRFRRSCCG